MTSPSLTRRMKQPAEYNHSYQVSVSSCFTKNTYSPPNTSVHESFTNVENLSSSQSSSVCVYVKCELCQKLFSKNSIAMHRRRCQKDMNFNIYSTNSFYNSSFSSQSHESSSSIRSAQVSQFRPSLTPQRESPLRELWGEHYNTYYCLFLSPSPSSRKNSTLEETRLQSHSCPKCPLTFQTYDELQDHILAHDFEECEEIQVGTPPRIVGSSSNFLVRRNPIEQQINPMIELRRQSVHDISNSDFWNQSLLNPSQQLRTFGYCKTKLLPKNNLEKNKKYEAEICVICLDDYKEEERLKRLPCLHLFHAQCVNRWFEKSNVCPCCKACIDETKSSL